MCGGYQVPASILSMNEGLIPQMLGCSGRKPSAARPLQGLPEQRRSHLIPREALMAWLIQVGLAISSQLRTVQKSHSTLRAA